VDGVRLALAARFGATHTIDSRAADPVAAVQDATGGRGADHVFEAVGLPALMQQGLAMLARGGTLTLVGAADRSAELAFRPRAFMSQQQAIRGCIYGNIHPGADLPRFARWYLEGRLKLDELHTDTIALDALPALFAQGGPRGGIRTVVRFAPHGGQAAPMGGPS
jgi:S-(hydroxymethyl)mycothiol dehydrogenase